MDEFDLKEFRDTWDDTEPFPDPQKDGCPFHVDHTKKYDLIMGIFRTVIDKKEYSRRALNLTTYVISKNPTNITGWWYRQQVLEHLGYDWNSEMDFLDDMLANNPKPYQMWNHRRWLDDRCETVPDEEKRLFRIICVDQKNFHAYNFFCWFIRRWGFQPYFMRYVTDIISVDPTNNSAFNFRYFIVEHEKMNVKQELDYTFSVLEKNTQNESATTYIRGLLGLDKTLVDEAKQKTTELNEKQSSKQLLALLYTIARLQNNEKEMFEICDKLSEIDPIKKVYWQDLKNVDQKFA